MRILIFGASGFIGSHLARFCENAGHEVIALCRTGKIPGFHGKIYEWSLGASLSPELIRDAVCAIHLAHDFNGKAGAERTFTSTVACARQLCEQGVPRQIFYSSYSAGKHATSLYGVTKFAIENAISGIDGMTIIRPGLVLGNGGLYGRIRKCAAKLPLVPLPGGGRNSVPVIEIEKLCRETLLYACGINNEKEANLFEPESVSLRKLVLDAAKNQKHNIIILPIPSQLVLMSLKVLEYFHIPLPVNSDNLKGFLANQNADHVSTFLKR